MSHLVFGSDSEYVVIFNGSREKLDLKGWRLVYFDAASGEVLHTHYFRKLRGSFDPGERRAAAAAGRLGTAQGIRGHNPAVREHGLEQDRPVWENIDLRVTPHYTAEDANVLAYRKFCERFLITARR